MELMQASTQWASRPADERFTSLTAMQQHFGDLRDRSRGQVRSTRSFRVVPVEGTDHKGIAVEARLPGGTEVEASLPTHWAFGQLCERAGAPASWLRRCPSELASDNFNWGLSRRDVEEVGFLVRDERGAPATLAAATGPNYGRIWNADAIDGLVQQFGNGIDGDFRVPGEFGKRVEVNQSNTTLYASDRDFFVFLADEEHRIDVPRRREFSDGTALTGSLARGFFAWNSEVGASTLGVATFLFDYACCNRIVWGAQDVKEVRIRHTSGAPDRYLEEVRPALISYANSETHSITTAIENARKARIDDVDSFLKTRFTGGQVAGIKLAFEADEQRKIENVWDAVTGITAYARGIQHQDARVAVERIGGALLAKAA